MAHRARRWLWFHHGVPFPWRVAHGAWMLAYPDVMGGGLLRDYEPGVWRFLRSAVTPGMVCVDAGANQGYHTLLLAKLVGRTGRVYALEPVAEEARRLRRNLTLNTLAGNVRVEVAALGATTGDLPLHVGPSTHRSRSSLATLPREVPPEAAVRRVPVFALDDYLRGCLCDGKRRLDVLKADVEGGEWDLLTGAADAIARYRPILVMEVADVATLQFGYQASFLVWLLGDLGYTVYEPDDTGRLGPLEPRDWWRTTVVALPVIR